MPPQMPQEQHAHPLEAMFCGIVIGIILGAVAMYYYEETAQLAMLQNVPTKALAPAPSAAAAASADTTNPLGNVKLNPFE